MTSAQKRIKKVKLGDYIELVDIRNAGNSFNVADLRGISIKKVLTPTKADTNGLDVKNYKVLKKGWFTYSLVTSRNGNKISIAYNDDCDCIVSQINPVFKIKDEDLLNPRYLMMFFNRSEFDRYSRFHSWGSARETFDWDEMCSIDIDLPEIDIQRKYVAIYESLLSNTKSFERNVDDLKLVCDAFIENLRKEKKTNLVGHLVEVSERNEGKIAKSEKGVSIQKVLIETKAKSSDVEKQKLVRTGYFAFNSNTSRNSDTLSIALNKDEPCAVSNTYVVFHCDDSLIPEYLYLWFKRKEFDRFARFHSWGSARETISLKDIEQYEVAIPSKEIQQAIVNLLKIYDSRLLYQKELTETISNICPVLIRGSILEGKGGETDAD